MFEDTICALSTASGVGALSIIRVSGKDSLEVVNSLFKGKNLTKAEPNKVYYGFIKDKDELVDEVMVSVFRAPKTFTAENLVEINCHGSQYIVSKILDLLCKNGSRLAFPGEFTQRAFLNGRIDLSQAEAVADLISAESKASHDIAISQMRGGVSTELDNLREELINFTSLIELELDFSQEDVEFANREQFKALIQRIKKHLESLIFSFEYGNALKNGVPVAIVGKPNAGKSSLLNVLLKEDRAIVSNIPGTTRDTIEEVLNIEGIKFRFIDTAGLRDTYDEIEAIGVKKAKDKIESAKIVIHLYEGDLDLLKEFEVLFQKKIVFNLRSKCDINTFEIKEDEMLNKDNFINFPISAIKNTNIEKLKNKLVSTIKSNVDTEGVIINNIRHKEALEKALSAIIDVKNGIREGLSSDLIAFHLRDCLNYLGEITGKIDLDKDILETIFSKFCIGK